MQLEDYFDFLAENDIRLKGSRIGIETILFNFIHRERSPEDIANTYTTLTLEEVYATIVYYLHNKEAVTKYLTDWIEWGRIMRRLQDENPPPAILELRKIKAERDSIMSIRYLMDENLDPLYKTQLLLKKPELLVLKVGDPGYPAKGTLDPEILYWCEETSFVLVTDNRASMPLHLGEHLARGRHVPGIIILNVDMGIGETLEELVLIAEVGTASKYRDRIMYLSVNRPSQSR